MFLISPVATRWSNSITNGSAEPPDLGDGTFHPSSGSPRGCRQPKWDATMTQGKYVAHSPGWAGASSTSLLTHVPGETQVEVGVPGCHPARPHCKTKELRHALNPPMATPTKDTLAVKASLGPSQGSIHCSVVASAVQPPVVSFLMASKASSPAQS